MESVTSLLVLQYLSFSRNRGQAQGRDLMIRAALQHKSLSDVQQSNLFSPFQTCLFGCFSPPLWRISHIFPIAADSAPDSAPMHSNAFLALDVFVDADRVIGIAMDCTHKMPWLAETYWQ